MTIAIEEFTELKQPVCADNRGRIALGTLAKEQTYLVSRNRTGKILLTPAITIPKNEQWLYQNPQALAAVQNGLAQAKAGNTVAIDFSEYVDIDIGD